MDLRKRLGLPAKAPDLQTQIVIVDSRGEPLGLIADEVIDIITLPRTALKPAEELSGVSSLLFAGLVHAEDRLILVLDLDRLNGAPSAGGAHA